MTAFAVLALSFFGVILGGRPFAKLHWAHLYVFDWVAIVWALLSLTKIRKDQAITFAKTNRWIVLYFLYGALLLAIDFFSSDFRTTPFNRVAQHSIIFVYPLIWVFIGFLSFQINSKNTDKVIAAILASYFLSQILRIFFQGAFEFSIGTVIIVFVLHFFSQASAKERLKGVVLLPLLYLPIWQMWGHYMSRTSLLEIILSIMFLPFIIFRKTFKRSLIVSSAMLLVLLAGFAVISEVKHSSEGSLVEGMKADFFDSTIHGEDVSATPGEHIYHARFRSFVWKTTISDWLTRPVLGVGFIPEIPSALEPGFKNQGGYYHEVGAPPVSGAHNSYLTILARMGPIGLGLLLLALVNWFKKMYPSKSFLDACLLVIPLFGLFNALFNIGIEAPQSSVIMWFCYGVGMAL